MSLSAVGRESQAADPAVHGRVGQHVARLPAVDVPEERIYSSKDAYDAVEVAFNIHLDKTEENGLEQSGCGLGKGQGPRISQSHPEVANAIQAR